MGWGHRDSSTGAGSLVVELGSEVLVPVGPRDGVSPLVSRAGARESQGCCIFVGGWSEVLESLTVCVAGGGLRAHVGLLVGEARAQGVLGLVLSHQWAEPSPEVIGCRALGA